MRKLTSKKWLIIALITVLVVVIALVLFDVFGSSKPNNNLGPTPTALATGNQPKPSETTNYDDLDITLNGYRVYQLPEVDFQFVIATFEVSGSESINIDLSHFKTSEGLALNNVTNYVDELEKNNYFLGRQNVWFSIISDQPQTQANIFIPISTKDASQITVTCDLKDSLSWTIDLSRNISADTDLHYQAEDIITDGQTYQMKVSAAYNITGEYMYTINNGEEVEYTLPSTTKVYVFKVEAVSLWGDDIVVEQAQYVPTTSSEVFDALTSPIRSMKYENMLDKTIVESDSGYLFFVAYDPDDHPVTYQGVLKLKLQGSDNWIEVHVDLN